MARTPSDTECASVSVTRSDSDSGRVASGLSPYGVASFCTLGWRLGVTRVEWSAFYPAPALPTCCRCPRDALEELAGNQPDATTLLGFSPIGAFPAYEPWRQGGRECAVR